MPPRGRPASRLATGEKQWSKNSEAYRFLERALQSGEIDPSEAPKQVYGRFAIFQQYKLENFRSAYNALKINMGLQVRRDGPGSEADEWGGGGDEGKTNRTIIYYSFYI